MHTASRLHMSSMMCPKCSLPESKQGKSARSGLCYALTKCVVHWAGNTAGSEAWLWLASIGIYNLQAMHGSGQVASATPCTTVPLCCRLRSVPPCLLRMKWAGRTMTACSAAKRKVLRLRLCLWTMAKQPRQLLRLSMS